MKLKFEFFFRCWVLTCVLVLGWAIWANAQTNAPAVQITAPKDGSVYKEGTPVSFSADIPAADNPVQRVEFIENGKAVGITSNAPFRFDWQQPTRGSHSVVAKVFYANGTVQSSKAVTIRVHDALLTFGLDEIDALGRPVFGIPLWQYCASLIYILLAFYISKFLDYAIRVWLKKWAEKTETQFDDLLIELLHGPVKVISFVIFLSVGLQVFPWPTWLENLLDKGFKIIVAVSITYTSLKAVDMLIGFLQQRNAGHEDKSLNEVLFPLLRKALKVFVVVIAVLMTSQNLGLNITAVITSLSISGLAIGLAAQDTIANFFGAVVVFMDKPFKIGDRIQLQDVDGIVETIGLRSTRVRSLDGYLVTVPNKTMGNATIVNVSRRPTIKTEMNFGVTYDTSAEKLNRALQILEEIYKSHPMTHDVLISFNRFGDSALNLQVVHWWKSTNYKDYVCGIQQMNLAVKKRFDAEGINMAFPSRTVYLKQDSEWKLGDSAPKAIAPPRLT